MGTPLPTMYIQPYASHREMPERLLVQDGAGLWYLWMGVRSSDELIELPETLAMWIVGREETDLLPEPRMWFDQGALPFRSEVAVFGD